MCLVYAGPTPPIHRHDDAAGSVATMTKIGPLAHLLGELERADRLGNSSREVSLVGQRIT